jgi:hypothetical protein
LNVVHKRRFITDSDVDEIPNKNEASLENINNENIDAVDQ